MFSEKKTWSWKRLAVSRSLARHQEQLIASPLPLAHLEDFLDLLANLNPATVPLRRAILHMPPKCFF
jgi:hypothetical protein